MRILHITSNNAVTGGAIAIERLSNALRESGHQSIVLTPSNVAQSPTVRSIDRSLGWRILDWPVSRLSKILALPNLWLPSISVIDRIVNDTKPDVIHLHWLYSGRTPICILKSLARRYPVVWTFHDMWAFTGGCTNSTGCTRWSIGCGKCPQWNRNLTISSMPRLRSDSTHLNWVIKRYIYKHSQFTSVGPSKWMVELARSSPLMAGKAIYHIPNGLDTDFWRPLDKVACKQSLGIAVDKKVILFVGKPNDIFFYSGRREVLLNALAQFREMSTYTKGKYVLLLVGDGGQNVIVDGYEIVAARSVTSKEVLRLCYNAADVLLDTTQFDNFPGVILESLACGTPVVASNLGGVPDMVCHLENGYLAEPTSPHEFALGLSWLFANTCTQAYLSNNARSTVVHHFSDKSMAKLMVDLYIGLLNNRVASSH